MIVLAISAALVGFIHSLSPGHWLPVVLTARSRQWTLGVATVGALVAASGHIVISTLVGAASILLEGKLLHVDEEIAERYAALLLVVFGSAYALFSYFRHSSCHGHTHHGPDPRNRKAPFVFLFAVGLSPCVAALPIFLAANAKGWGSVLITMLSFAGGVSSALIGATFVVSLGLLKLDHPIFEHFGDVLTGAAVALMGGLLFFFPI